MDNIKFNQTGGFPLDTDILGAMQTSYGLFNQLGSLAGDLTILAGCEEVGNNVSEGIVFIAGEVLPFKGGTRGTTVIIAERTEDRIFEDGVIKTVIYRREAIFGSSTSGKTYQWEDFKRIKTLIQLEAEKATKTALEDLKKELLTELNKHIGNKENPHQVKREQLGILKVGSIQVGNIVKSAGIRYENADYTAMSMENNGYDELIRISFKVPLKTSNYIVVGNFTSYSGYWNDNNDIGFITSNKTTGSFDLAVREYSVGTQSLQFDFVIMSLD